MANYESVVDRWVERAIEHYGNSDMQLKMSCIVASAVVGTYSGGAQVIAKAINRSVSTVENHAHAGKLYKALRRDAVTSIAFRHVRNLWRALPASHWWLAYDIQQAGYKALNYLAMADFHGWSGRAMMGEFDKDLHAGTAPLIFSRAVLSFRGLADELYKRPNSLTDRQLAAVCEVLDAFA